MHVDAVGALVLVTADAMGKGLQSALVIHAVQSLWAENLNNGRSFEPEKWLKNVNIALYNMGKSATHMVTVGVVRLDGFTGTYWSAGHVPLFLFGKGEQESVKGILPKGSPLGIMKDLVLKSRSFDLQIVDYLMLGSDGVFDKGSRHNQKEILAIRKKISMPTPSLETISSADDDKTLIAVDFADFNAFDTGKLQPLQSMPLLKAG